MGSPSRIRRIAKLAETAPSAAAGLIDFSILFPNALHHNEQELFRRIMASIDRKVQLDTDFVRLDAAIAVSVGLIMCRCLDSGMFDEVERLGGSWRRHSAPLIAAINSKNGPVKKGKSGDMSMCELASALLSDEAPDDRQEGEEQNDFI